MDDSQGPAAWLCVLGSGSGGNCSLLAFSAGGERRVWMIDAGFSPRRTRVALEELGLKPADLDGVLLTHLDHDHWHRGWANALPERVRVRTHRAHAADAARAGVPKDRLVPIDEDGLELCDGVEVRTVLADHDEHGVAAMRIRLGPCGDGGATLGYATDVGRLTDELVGLLAGVDVLAIESNYCPRMQMESNRPGFLKARIMGGAGHLSNHEALEAVREARPRTHVVFLHLSRQCNHPSIVESLHRGADYPFTIADQFQRTERIRIEPGPERPPLPQTAASSAFSARTGKAAGRGGPGQAGVQGLLFGVEPPAPSPAIRTPRRATLRP